MPESEQELREELIKLSEELLEKAQDEEDIKEEWETKASQYIWESIDYLADKRAKERSISSVTLEKVDDNGDGDLDSYKITITNGLGTEFTDTVSF